MKSGSKTQRISLPDPASGLDPFDRVRPKCEAPTRFPLTRVRPLSAYLDQTGPIRIYSLNLGLLSNFPLRGSVQYTSQLDQILNRIPFFLSHSANHPHVTQVNKERRLGLQPAIQNRQYASLASASEPVPDHTRISQYTVGSTALNPVSSPHGHPALKPSDEGLSKSKSVQSSPVETFSLSFGKVLSDQPAASRLEHLQVPVIFKDSVVAGGRTIWVRIPPMLGMFCGGLVFPPSHSGFKEIPYSLDREDSDRRGHGLWLSITRRGKDDRIAWYWTLGLPEKISCLFQGSVQVEICQSSPVETFILGFGKVLSDQPAASRLEHWKIELHIE
ncbi:hypothetical protein DY000_02006702 [Brassica cretica]|uniref:Uncharacterized protein n=1 Tax=Brassica cretica TaxID=69181 RepID=A0ABQ7CD00_BRACR|nr:hypothetical protein DY000_02006702 [Brassica cretica]